MNCYVAMGKNHHRPNKFANVLHWIEDKRSFRSPMDYKLLDSDDNEMEDDAEPSESGYVCSFGQV